MNFKIWRKRSDNSLVGFCDADYLGFEPGGDLTSYAVSVHDSEAVLAEWQAQQAPLQYQHLRAAAYPSFADQFDLLYHGGIEAWKAAIQSVKTRYPKELPHG